MVLCLPAKEDIWSKQVKYLRHRMKACKHLMLKVLPPQAFE